MEIRQTLHSRPIAYIAAAIGYLHWKINLYFKSK